MVEEKLVFEEKSVVGGLELVQMVAVGHEMQGF